MKIDQRLWTKESGWGGHDALETPSDLVLVFGGRAIMEDASHYDTIRRFYPRAHIMMCSTAGEIMGTRIYDDSLVVTALTFEHTRLEIASLNIRDLEDSYHAGAELARRLTGEELKNILIISDGQNVNGSQLVKGINSKIPPGVIVTGGLAGDGALFEKTLVGINSAPSEGTITAVGFYSSRLHIGHGSMGGWDSFGPERLITKSASNVLYEMDHRSALALYKEYLGDRAADLPGSGLLFPLCIRTGSHASPVVRTILSVNEKDQSMTFAGDMPEGSYARLMKAGYDSLIDGATKAAEEAVKTGGEENPCCALLISCVGRKLVLRHRVEEELEGIQGVFGEGTVMAGFYSYGEVSPYNATGKCELYNQTMTITTFTER